MIDTTPKRHRPMFWCVPCGKPAPRMARYYPTMVCHTCDSQDAS